MAQHMSEQERNAVGSALKGPVYQGQPVNHKNNVDTDKGFAMQGGTIHPPDKSGGILYPSTPRSKTFQECARMRCENCSEGNNTKYQFISCPLRKELKRYEVIK